MKCPMMGPPDGGDFFVTMMTLKAIIAVWIIVIPFMFLKRLDKLIKILEDKKK